MVMVGGNSGTGREAGAPAGAVVLKLFLAPDDGDSSSLLCLSMRFQTPDKVVSWIKAVFQHADVAARTIARAAFDVAELVLADEEDIEVRAITIRRAINAMCVRSALCKKKPAASSPLPALLLPGGGWWV